MGHKRDANDVCRPFQPKPHAKRQRAVGGLPRHVSPPFSATPARPPKMPTFKNDNADRSVTSHLQALSGSELYAMLKDMEKAYRRYTEFEIDEVQRATRMGHWPSRKTGVIKHQY